VIQLMGSTRMSGADATWLHLDRPQNRMIVNTVLCLDGPVDWDAIEESFFERVVRSLTAFRSRVVDPPVTIGLIGPRWEPVEAQRTDHIRSVTLPSPGGDAELHAYIAGEASKPLDDRVPLWQLHFIDGCRGGGAVLLRTHHALGDGPTLVHALNTWAGPPEHGDSPIDRRSGSERPGRSVGSFGATAGLLGKLVTGFGAQAGVIGGEVGGTKSVAWTAPVPLESVKRLGRETKSTVNDVCLALIAGALGQVQGAAGPKRIEAIVPVNLRSRDESIEQSLGNRFGLVFATLPTTVDDVRQRIARVKAEMDRIKSTQEARTVLDTLTVLGGAPKPGAQAWVDAFTRRASVVITNVAGPVQRLRLGPSEVGEIALWVPTTGPIGIGVSICSYAGSLRFGVIVDIAVIADPTRLALALDEQTRVATTDPTRL
jgi:diacylglycerol O-acyltransferase